MISVYVTSLPDSHVRRAFIRRQLEPMGVPFQFFDGVDGGKLSSEELIEAAPGGGIHYCGLLTPREIGCALSHLAVIREIAAGEADYAAVLEDDVSILPSACKFFDEQFLRSLPPFDILQLDGAHPKKPRLTLKLATIDGFEFCALTKCHHSMYALIYSRKCARRITASVAKVSAPIDNMIFKDFLVPALRVVAVRPSVVTHCGFPTVIGNRPEVKSLTRKAERELRRIQSWWARWVSFAQVWGLEGVLGLRLRRAP